MIKYGKTGQFRQAIKNLIGSIQFEGIDEAGDPVYDMYKYLPTIPFVGTVKLHGTNASISMHSEDKVVTYHSRENVLSRDKDNAGFCNAMMDLNASGGVVNTLFDMLCPPRDCRVTIYGEWAGEGIQRGVGISTKPKAFYIYSVRFDYDVGGTGLLDMQFYSDLELPACGIYNLWNSDRYPIYKLDIDLNDPLKSIEALTKMTEEVEAHCPVADLPEGEECVGEGIVWHPDFITEYYLEPSQSGFRFKVKGEKHSDTKVKKLVSIDPEVVESINVFVSNTCTDHRLEKGLSFLQEEGKPLDLTSTGTFVNWAKRDILSEEQDTITESKLDRKMLPGAIAKVASLWYRKHLNDNL